MEDTNMFTLRVAGLKRKDFIAQRTVGVWLYIHHRHPSKNRLCAE